MGSLPSSEDHGGLDPRELESLGLLPSDVLDFSVNGNPYGPSPRVRRAISRIDVSRYPDRSCARLTGMLATANGVPPSGVLVGNGSSELIWCAAAAFLTRGDRVLIAGPTFGEYTRACRAFGADVVEVRGQPPDFPLSIPELTRAIEEQRPRVVFLCNPNNPTGRLLDPESLSIVAAACSRRAPLIVDEAYRAFAWRSPFGPPPPGVDVTLRSMTKDFALAGLRLGYALAVPDIIQRCARFQPAWSVSAPAQAAGEAALADLAFYTRALARVRVDGEALFRSLRAAGVSLVPSDTHFTLVRLGEPARGVRRRLLDHGVQVRDCFSFGLPDHIRVAARLPSQNRRLVEAFRAVNAERRGT